MDYLNWESPIGRIQLVTDEKSLLGLYFEGQRYYDPGDSVFRTKPETEIQDAAVSWLTDYFRGKRPPTEQIAINIKGTPFQKMVWEFLLEIPYGMTVTYGELARKMERKTGHRMSGQAIGGAVGRNPISIIIPCHRVMGVNGRLTGYAGGIERKQWLLKHENAISLSTEPGSLL